jgi:hypothetical protein
VRNWQVKVRTQQVRIAAATMATHLAAVAPANDTEHMRCMVWVGSAVVTPAQGPQAANTVKVAKYYVGAAAKWMRVDRRASKGGACR